MKVYFVDSEFFCCHSVLRCCYKGYESLKNEFKSILPLLTPQVILKSGHCHLGLHKCAPHAGSMTGYLSSWGSQAQAHPLGPPHGFLWPELTVEKAVPQFGKK